jgi:hypothetical protein
MSRSDHDDLRTDQGSLEEVQPEVAPVTTGAAPDVISEPSALGAGEIMQPEAVAPAPIGGN